MTQINNPGFPALHPNAAIGGYRGLQPGDPYTDRTPHRRTAIRSQVAVLLATVPWERDLSGKALAIRAGSLASSGTNFLHVTINDTDLIILSPNVTTPRPWSLTLSPISIFKLKLEAFNAAGVKQASECIVTLAENPLDILSFSP